MAKKKVAPNRSKHSPSREAEEAALQLGALTAARNTMPPFASDAAENTAPSSSKNTTSSPAKNMVYAPVKTTAPSLVENSSPSPPKNPTSSSPAKSTTTSSAKNPTPASSNEDEEAVPPFPSDAAKNMPPARANSTAPASAKNKAPGATKNKASVSAKNAVVVAAASNEDEVAAPPQEATLRRFINFLCEKATSMWWQGLLDAFLTWVCSARDDKSEASERSIHDVQEEGSTHQEKRENRKVRKNQRHRKGTNKIQQQASPHLPEAEALTEGYTNQEQMEKKEQRNQMFLEETKKTEQQASPHLPEESRFQNHAYIYAKKAQHKNGRDRDETKADSSVPAGPSISQASDTTLYTDETEADRIIPVGPSISKIVEDSQNFDRYLSRAIHKHYIELMSRRPPGMMVCTFCYFERGNEIPRSHSSMIPHLRQSHPNMAGVKCTNCPARFPTERDRTCMASTAIPSSKFCLSF